MAATAAQVTALETALYQGHLTVRFDDRSVTYRSVSELKQALAEANASLEVAAGTRRRVVRLYSGSDK